MVSRLKVISRIFVLGASATERGKMDPSLNRSWENERTQNLGAQALENMPSFSEHMQKYEDTVAWEDSFKNPKNVEQFQKNFDTMDERTRMYVWRFGSNVDKLVGGDRELSGAILDTMNQAIQDGKLNNAYLGNDGILHIQHQADEYRGYDENGWQPDWTNEEYNPTPTIELPPSTDPDYEYWKNYHTMDNRTLRYIRDSINNIDLLFGEFMPGLETKEGKLSKAFTDQLNNAIRLGKLNGAYLNDKGFLNINTPTNPGIGDEYRGYDGKAPYKPIFITPDLDNHVDKKEEHKTEIIDGFEDW
ncbi:hypothetical protein IKE83_02170 [Candidatus Saccharibacteria bacterium]|nr:hypothetical protein [Candidatus Saccharibacteria bacterium]